MKKTNFTHNALSVAIHQINSVYVPPETNNITSIVENTNDIILAKEDFTEVNVELIESEKYE